MRTYYVTELQEEVQIRRWRYTVTANSEAEAIQKCLRQEYDDGPVGWGTQGDTDYQKSWWGSDACDATTADENANDAMCEEWTPSDQPYEEPACELDQVRSAAHELANAAHHVINGDGTVSGHELHERLHRALCRVAALGIDPAKGVEHANAR